MLMVRLIYIYIGSYIYHVVRILVYLLSGYFSERTLWMVCSCSNVPPGPIFSCEEQVDLEKCFRSWMYTEAFCLRSCGRCGDGCIDIPPPGSSCDASRCESEEYIGTGLQDNYTDPTSQPTMPYCLKTCRRCSITDKS